MPTFFDIKIAAKRIQQNTNIKFVVFVCSVMWMQLSFAQTLSLGGNQIICANSNSTTVTATTNNLQGLSVSSYAWTIDGVSVGTNSSSTLTVNASLNPNNPQVISCIVTLTNGTNTSTINDNISVYTINPGVIAGDQFSCTAPFNPNTITSTNNGTTSLSGASISYQWQSSSNGTTWANISGQNNETYNPNNINTSTYYRRALICSAGGTTATCYSNQVAVGILVVGSIGSNQVICSNSSPNTLTNTVSASIISPASIQYQWQSSTDNINWTNISGANSATYNPSGLSQDSYFRRSASIVNNSVTICTGHSNAVFIDFLTNFSIDAGSNVNTCVGENITINPTVNGISGYNVQYQWTGPNNFSSSNLSPTLNNISLNANGTYNLSATIGNCTLYDNIIIDVLGVSITSGFFNGNNTQLVNCLDPQDVNGIIGLNLVLPNNLSSVQSVSINWGDGPSVVISSANYGNIQLHTYSPGAYDITVTITSTSGCSSSVVYPAFIGSSPSPAALQIFINQANGCVPHFTEYTFSVPSTNVTGTTYTVTWGDGTPNEVYTHPNVPSTLSHTYNISSCGSNVTISGQTYYNVYQPSVITQNPCSVQPQPSAAGLISVGLGPDASFTVSRTTLCQGGNVQINNTSNFGLTVPTSGGASCLTTSPYYWTITNSNGNSTGYTVLSGSLGSNNGVTGTGPNIQNSWTSGSINPNVQFNVPGIYTINLIVKNKCGLDISSQTICVISPPVSSIVPITAVQCSPATIALSSNSTLPMCGSSPNPVAYQWNVTNPAGCSSCSSTLSSSTLANTTLNLVNNTTTIQTFTVSLTLTPLNPANNLPLSSPGCAHTSTTTIQVYPKPVYTPIDISTCNDPFQVNVNLQSTTNLANSTFIWSAANNSNIAGESTSNQTSSVVNDNLDNTSTSFQTLTYTVTPTSSFGCAGNAATFTVTMNYVDPGVVSNNQTICSGTSPALLTGTSPNGAGTFNYQWQSSTNGTTWINISGATNASYQPGNLNSNIYFRRIVNYVSNSVTCSGTSNSVLITVNSISPGTIGAIQNLCAGDDPAALNIVTGATGTGTTTFIWQQSSNANGPWTSIAGQTGSSYDPPVLNATTYFSIAVTSVLNGVSCSTNTPSSAVNIYSLAPGSISSSLTTICEGGNLGPFVYNPPNTNAPSVSYQWQSSIDNSTWVDIAGATAAGYDPPALTTTTYYRRIENALVGSTVICQGQSNSITITVVPDPTVSTPSGQTICTGGTPAALTVSPTGGISTTYSYQWFNSSNVSVSTSSSYTPPASNNSYYCQVTINPATATGCSVVSSPAQITVVTDPVVSAPIGATYCQDAASVSTLSITASGGLSSNYTYQWFVNNANNNSGGTAIAGANTPNYTPPVNTTGTKYYYCLVTITPTSTGCSTASAVATIIVTPGPSITTQPASQTRCIGGTFSALSFISAGGSGTPTYQWFSNTTNSNTGGIPISGAINATYTPPSSLSATAGVTYYYCVISFSSSGGCSVISTNAAAITVLAAPTLNAMSNQVYCHANAVPSTAFTGNYSSGMSYSWNLSGQTIGLSSTSGSGSSIPAFTASNTGTTPRVATVNVTPSYTITNVNSGGSLTCAGAATAAFTFTINPIPDMPAFIPQLFVFCEDYQALVPFTANITTGMSYQWTNDNTQIGVAATGTSTSPGLSFTAVNNLSNPNQPLTSNFYVTPVYTNQGLSCPGTAEFFAITINPKPDVNPVPDMTLCATNTGNNQYSSFNPIVGLPTTYVWTNTNTAIGLPATGTGTLYFTSTNTSLVPISGTISVTPTYTNNGVTCTGAVDQFEIIVNPMPTVNAISLQGLCVGGSTTAVTPTGNIPGTIYTWSNNNISTGLGSGGTGTIPSFVGQNTTNAPNVSTVQVVPSYTNNNLTCTGTAVQFGININPSPNVDAIADKQVCAQENTSVQFTSTPNIVGTVYNWTNNNTAIGLAASGTGAISFNATNTTSAPISATITVTPSFTNAGSTCWGAPETFDIVVLPTPVMTALANQTVCSGTASSALNFTSNLSGTLFSWTNSNTSIGLAANGIANNIGSFNTINTGSSPAQGLITVSPSLVTNNQNCIGTPVTATITVNPIPAVNTVNNPSFCFGAAATIPLSSNINTGVVYNWTNSNTGIGLGASGSGSISFSTSNSFTTPISGLITVSPIYTNNNVQCAGNPSTFTIQVAPNPQVNTLSNVDFCSGVQSTLITLSGTVTGTTYSWTNSNTTIGLQAQGTGNIPVFTTANPSTTSVASSLVTVTPNLTFNGQSCQGPAAIFTISINPGTTINSVPNVKLCNGETSLPINFSGSGSTYAWSSNNTNIGIASNGVTSILPFVATNTGVSPINATITVTSQFTGGSGNGCNGGSTTFNIEVLPTPTVIDPPNLVECHNEPIAAVNLYGVATNYVWTNNTPSIGLINTGSTAIIPAFTATNTGNNPVLATISISPSYVSGTKVCTGTSQTYTINVIPIPTITSQPQSQTVCLGGTLTNLSVAFSGGNGTPTFQWFSSPTNSTTNGSAIAGATSSTYTLPAASSVGTTYYYCTLTFANGATCSTISSALAQITVTSGPTISTQPLASQAICVGGSIPAPLSVAFSNGTGNATIQWFSVAGGTNTPISGANTVNYLPGVFNTVGTYSYMVQISLSGSGCGLAQSNTVQVNVLADPTITSPSPASYCLNSSTAIPLTVTASGGTTNPYLYQWYSNSVNNNTGGSQISGANAASYIPPTTATATTYYYCVVTQGNGCSVSSNTAAIAITAAPTINSQPIATQTVCLGGTLSPLSVSYASGSGSPSYQWYSNSINSYVGGVAIPGSAGASYTPVTSAVGTIYYYCVITFASSGCSSISSNISQINVVADPFITTQPLNTQTICSGGSIPTALSILYNGGTGNVSYQWSTVNGSTNTPIGSATNSTYLPPAFSSAGNYNFAVQITLSGSGCGMVQSNNAQVIVLPDPTLSAPISATYCNGYSPVQPLSVTPNGGLSAAYAYQWYSNVLNSNTGGTLINGATASTYTPPVTTNGSLYYYCVMSQGAANTGCSSPSTPALITVSPAPAIANQPTSLQTACVGGTLTNLTVSYTGASTTPNYQWYSNAINANTGGTPIPGATNPSYLPQNTTAGTVYYYCVISFPAISCTTISSNPGGVIIHPDPIISVQPIANQAICFGTTLSTPLNISYTGGFGTPSYQWNIVTGSNVSPISGATNSSYLPNAFNVAGTYNFNVTLNLSGNGCNSQTSSLAEVIVMPVPIVDSVPSELYCNDDLADLIEFDGPITGTTFAWVNDNPGIGLAASGFGDIIPFTVTNLNNFGILGNISVTPQLTTYNTTCSGTPFDFVIMVNPYQDVQDPQDLVLCHGTGVNGVQFFGSALINNWTNDLPALGIPASGSGTLPAFLAVNNGTQPIIAHLSVTPSFNAVTTCPGDIETFTITILPNPNAVVSPTSQTICSGDISTTINMSGNATSFEWTNNQPSIGLPATGTGNIPGFLTTATGSNTTSTISVTPIYTYAGVSCPGPFQNVQITVVPTPEVQGLQDLVYCNGDATNLVQIIGNASELNWTSSNPSIGTAASGTGSIPSFNVVNSTTSPVSTVITITPVNYFAGLTCLAPAENFSIIVNPTPTIIPVQDEVLCAQSNSPAFIFSGNANNFIWSNSNDDIGIPSNGVGNISSFVAQNGLPSVQMANISVTPQFINAGLTCSGAPELFVINVLPNPTITPIATQQICNGQPSDPIIFTGNANTYNWINNNTSIGLAASGSGNIGNFIANAGAVNNIANIVVTPSYSYNSTTCFGAPLSTTITVLPSPTITPIQDLVVCNGSSAGVLAFSGTTTTFNWTNSNPSIGLAAAGSGNLPNFTYSNISSNPTQATITVTPQNGQGAQTCIGSPEIFTITVVPTPSIAPILNYPPLCSQEQTAPVIFSGNANNYTWINSNTSIGLASSGSGTSIPAFIAQNSGVNTQIATIQVTPQYINGSTTCLGTPQNFTFSVDPIPTVQYSQLTQAVCSGLNSSVVNFNSPTQNVTFAWSIPNPAGQITGINSFAGTGNLPSMTLVNPGSSSAQFNFQGSATTALAGCTGYGPLGTITVNQAPIIQALNDTTICSNSLLNYSISASIPSTFSWSTSVNSNITGQPNGSVNSNLIYNTLQNNSAVMQYLTYTVTPTSAPFGCVGLPETFVAGVVPNIQITSVANYDICSGDPTNITLQSNLPGTFTFTALNNSNVQGESTTSQTGFYINDLLTNNTAYDQIVSYNVQLASNPQGCFGLPQVVQVEVHPELFVTNVTPTQICSGDPLNLTLTATENANFTWYATQNAIVTGESINTQNNNILNDLLVNNSNSWQEVQYTINAISTVTGCESEDLPFSIIVNPIPVVPSFNDQVWCAGTATNAINFTQGSGTNYVWTNNNSSIGLLSSGSGNIPSFNVINPGPQNEVATITVTPQYINNGFVCSGTQDQITITVEPIPSITYSLPNQVLCSGNSSAPITFISPTNGVSYTWQITSAPTSITGIPNLSGANSIPSMTLTSSSPNSQFIEFVATVSTPLMGCQTVGPVGTIQVYPEPVINNINDVTICSNDVLLVNINSNIASATYSWGAVNNPNISGESVGPVNSNVILNTLLNTSSTVQYVDYTIVPTYSISPNNPALQCVGVPESFTVEVIPNIALDTLITPLFDSICSGELTNILLQTNYPANITWYAVDNPNVSGETTVSTSGSYINDILVNNTPFNQYVTYYIDMLSSPNACAGIPQLITIKVFPAIQLTNATNLNVCSNDPLDLDLAATVNATFSWSAINNGVVTGESTTAQNTSLINDSLTNASAVTEQVFYSVNVTALNSNCQANDLPITINVLPLPVLLNEDITICSGDSTDINLTTNIPANIEWNGVFNIPIIGETYSSITGNYINDILNNNTGVDQTQVYEILAISNGCEAPLDSVLVTVHDLPDIDFNVVTSPLCSEDIVQFTNLSNTNFDFDWSFGDGGSSTDFSPQYVYNNWGVYEVMLTGTNPINDCSASDSLTIVVNKMPDASFYTLDSIGCGELNATFFADYESGNDMIWDFGDGQTLAQAGNVTNYYGVAGCYDVTLTVTSPAGCIAQESYDDYVCVYENPIASISASEISVNALHPTIQFSNASQHSISYVWEMGDGNISYDDNPTYTYPMEGADYHVLMTAYNEVGCFDTASIDINVYEELIFYVPNTFTPNEDEKNQTFLPILSQGMKRNYMEFYVYNRWGELVFESHDPSYGWDGTFGPNSLDCPVGSYTWKLKLETLQTQEILDFHGHVNLIR